MSAADSTDYETILRIVRDWPPARRFTLVQDVLRTLSPAETAERPRQATLAQAHGLLAGKQPVPSDDDVARWLDEHRQERYGS